MVAHFFVNEAVCDMSFPRQLCEDGNEHKCALKMCEMSEGQGGRRGDEEKMRGGRERKNEG